MPLVLVLQFWAFILAFMISAPLAVLTSTLSNSKPCERCEGVPNLIFGPGTLYLRPPMAHSRGKIVQWLREEQLSYQINRGLLVVEIEAVNLAPLAQKLADAVTEIEADDINALFRPRGAHFEVADWLEVQPLSRWLGSARLGWLIDMMNEGRLTSFFHPIVDAQTGAIFAHEALLRGIESDQIVPPNRIFEVAHRAGMGFQIDLAARRSAIKNAATHRISGKIFINFTPTTIYDPVNCLKTTVALIKECGFHPEDIVFEVIESAQATKPDHLTQILDFYRQRGFGVALDDLGAGFSSLNLMVALRPDFVKLDRELISGVDCDPYKAVIARKLLETARDLGVKTVAEGVETKGEWSWLRENRADYLQGFLLAKPALPPQTVNWPV